MTSSSERAGLEPAQVEASRRAFLQRLCLGLGALCGALLGAPIIVFFLGPLIRQPAEAWRPVGKVGRFRVGEVAKVDFVNTSPLPWSGQAARSAAWLQRLDADRFRAFAVKLHPSGLPGGLASRTRPVLLSLPRRRLLQGRHGGGGSAAQAAAAVSGAGAQRAGGDPHQSDPDHHQHHEMRG